MFGQKTHQDEAGRDPGPEREDHAEPGGHNNTIYGVIILYPLGVHGPRLPLHRLHDLRLPHPRQALLHPGPHERGRPPLPSLTGQ